MRVASRRWILAEIVLILAVFTAQGTVPVPDVNEPYYLGKAVHYWNAAWAPGDFFLDTKDTHEVFYYTFGWLSLWLPLGPLAWTGRLLTWGLLAWAWRRVSFALLPRRGLAVLTAALMVCLVERCHMAGEWIVGGVEAKGFAFVLVLLGIEAIVRNRWNRAWLLLGAASAFHVLVGGWSVVAAMVAWGLGRLIYRDGGNTSQGATAGLPSSVCPEDISCTAGQASSGTRKPRIRLFQRVFRTLGGIPGPGSSQDPGDGGNASPVPPLRSMLPALFGGLLLSLPGLWPALTLNWGVDAKTLADANFIYVYRRLWHHLDPGQIPALLIVRFTLLGLLWFLLCRATPADAAGRRFRAFIAGAVAISLAGVVVFWISLLDMRLGAALLRFYWFRLADVIVPAGVAVEAVGFALARMPSRPAFARAALALAILVATAHVGARLVKMPSTVVPPTYRLSDDADDFHAWRDACRWIAESDQIAPDAQFITPGMAQTFKWYAGRGEVANWKEIPQDARAIVQWAHRFIDLYRADRMTPEIGWTPDLRTERIEELARRYGADYMIAAAYPSFEFPIVYQNDSYVVYRLEADDDEIR